MKKVAAFAALVVLGVVGVVALTEYLARAGAPFGPPADVLVDAPRDAGLGGGR